MDRQTKLLAVAALLMMGMVAAFLSAQQQWQRLGEPGVKVVRQPVYDPHGTLAGTNSVYLPERLLDMGSTVMPIAREVLDWLPLDTTYAQKIYHSTNGFEVLVNVVLMGADRTSIHKPEYCLRGSGWQDQQYQLDTVTVRSPQEYELPVMRVLATRAVAAPHGGRIVRRGIYVFWFVADGERTARHGERMWSMARTMLTTGVLQRWAYISVFGVCAPGEEEAAYGRIKSFIAALAPEVHRSPESPIAWLDPLGTEREHAGGEAFGQN